MTAPVQSPPQPPQPPWPPRPPAAERKPLTKKEIAADHPTWCPGCGDFSVLALYFKLIEKRKLWQEKFTTIAGIGCSSRFPYFVQAYGAHYIHGRSLPFASGDFALPARPARLRVRRRRRRSSPSAATISPTPPARTSS